MAAIKKETGMCSRSGILLLFGPMRGIVPETRNGDVPGVMVLTVHWQYNYVRKAPVITEGLIGSFTFG